MPPIDGVKPTTFFDETELRVRRGDDQIACERKLEGRGKGEGVGGEDNRRRQLFDLVDHRQQVGPELAPLLRCEAGEDMDVYAARNGTSLRTDQQRPWRVRGDICDRAPQVIDHPLVEEVERRAVEGDDREAVLALESRRGTFGL